MRSAHGQHILNVLRSVALNPSSRTFGLAGATSTATSLPGKLEDAYQALPAAARHLQGFARIAEHEKGKTKFSGYHPGGFVINNVQVPGSVIAQTDLFLMWRPRTMAEVTPESLVFLDLITPVPEVLILGCGAVPVPLPAPVGAFLKARGIKVEVLDSRHATGYFNILNDEGRIVVGALLAADPSIPLLEAMPKQEHHLLDRPFLQ